MLLTGLLFLSTNAVSGEATSDGSFGVRTQMSDNSVAAALI